MADNRASGFSSRTSWVSGRGAAAKKPSRRSSGCEESLRAAAAAAEPAEDEWAPDDVLQLEDLDDSIMLRVLWTRYQQRLIYTWCGGVLISVNPYRDVGAFSAEVATAYAAAEPPIAPHLYATVRHALAAPGSKHAILITGESGAGKTEATRAILSFLAMKHSTADHIRDRLLLSTPVLEAFGNARTRQNANSSRFGKFIEVHMSADLQVIGASLQPYMLEASRVAGALPEGEDTYHVFYLLRAAILTLASGNLPSGNFWARLSRSPEWTELSRVTMNDFASSGRLSSNTMTARRNLDWFEDLCSGLVALGIAEKEVVECFRLVAAVALLAEPLNQSGREQNGGNGPEAGAGPSAATAGVAAVAKLLGASPGDLEGFLTSTESWVGGKERLKRARSGLETATLRASLAQELYAALFSWLTRHVAKGIAPTENCTGGRALGLLDLYGFEVFACNGFEQFLINYCNERLQQFFNRQVFAAEAEEYRAEGLDDDGKWCQLMVSCQLPALTLLEGAQDPSQIGIFGVVNDRSKTALKGDLDDSASNRGQVAEAIAAKCGKHSAFRRPARDADRRFGVVHFAGEVFYEAGQFVRKNASSHRPDIVEFLRRHGGTFVQNVVGLDGGGSQGQTDAEKAQKGRKLFGRTLITIFREELQELCSTLEARQCRHVRCLRPNDEQAVLVFDDESMLRQCRYSGLLEATRIRRAGYAHRRSQLAFATRYAVLLPLARRATALREDASLADECTAICQLAEENGVATEDMRVGQSKVFLRDAALSWLEANRERRAAEKVHAALRGFVVRRMVQRLNRIVVVLQAHARRRIACLLAQRLRREKAVLAAALSIQSIWRGTLTRRYVADQLGRWHSGGPSELEPEPLLEVAGSCESNPAIRIEEEAAVVTPAHRHGQAAAPSPLAWPTLAISPDERPHCRPAIAAPSPGAGLARATSPERPVPAGISSAIGAPTPQRSAAASPTMAPNHAAPTMVQRTPKVVKRSYSAHNLLRTVQASTPSASTPAGPVVKRQAVRSNAGAYTPVLPRPQHFPHSMMGPPGKTVMNSHLPAREGIVLRAPYAVPGMRLWRHLPQPRGGWPTEQRATPKGTASMVPLRLASLGSLPTPCRIRRGASPTPATPFHGASVPKQGFTVPSTGSSFTSPQLVRRTLHIVPRAASANGPPGPVGVPKPLPKEGALQIPSGMTAVMQGRHQQTVQAVASPRLASFTGGGSSRGCSPTRPAAAPPRPIEA
mmetsp:Transcript_13867/g.25492  ORF Transcript_13867/g.25492 Transcript_13867/m.25492 type:complete len:1236 (+) Transcript_13867:41-3748(+)